MTSKHIKISHTSNFQSKCIISWTMLYFQWSSYAQKAVYFRSWPFTLAKDHIVLEGAIQCIIRMIQWLEIINVWIQNCWDFDLSQAKCFILWTSLYLNIFQKLIWLHHKKSRSVRGTFPSTLIPFLVLNLHWKMNWQFIFSHYQINHRHPKPS